MAKVGLKETLQLLAAGYKKKDIEALAAIDETENLETETAPVSNDSLSPTQAPDQTEQAPQPDPEPDYKAMYEALLKEKGEADSELKEKEEKIKKIQKENTNTNSMPDVEKMKKESTDSLIDAIRSFY